MLRNQGVAHSGTGGRFDVGIRDRILAGIGGRFDENMQP